MASVDPGLPRALPQWASLTLIVTVPVLVLAVAVFLGASAHNPTFGADVSIPLTAWLDGRYGLRMRLRLLIAPLVAAGLIAAAVIASPAAEAAAAKACPASGLVIWAGEEPGGGTAGSVYYRIEFTNLSGHTCTVSGYPKVHAVDLKGRRIGSPATHAAGKKAKVVKLAPGASATATLQIVDALNYSPDECRPTTAAGLRVSVPGGAGSKIAPLAFETCALASAQTLAVAPVTKAN
jgi:Protein of unknown function (DUF4232)